MGLFLACRRITLALGLALLVPVVCIALAQAQAPPTLTELEQAKVELLQVRTAYARLLAQHDGCKAEVGTAFLELGRLRAAEASRELTAEETRLKATVEAGHPGFLWDAKTGTFTAKPAEPQKVEKSP